jgi:hypothetical protein
MLAERPGATCPFGGQRRAVFDDCCSKKRGFRRWNLVFDGGAQKRLVFDGERRYRIFDGKG